MLSVIEYDCSAHGLTEQADIHRPLWRHSTRSSPFGVTLGFHLSAYSVFDLTGSSPCGRLSKSETCCSRILLLGRRMAIPPLDLRAWYTSGLVSGITPEWILPGRSNALWQHKLSVSAGGRPAPFHHSVMVHIAGSWARLSAPSHPSGASRTVTLFEEAC
jgi:hypothetical protein